MQQQGDADLHEISSNSMDATASATGQPASEGASSWGGWGIDVLGSRLQQLATNAMNDMHAMSETLTHAVSEALTGELEPGASSGVGTAFEVVDQTLLLTMDESVGATATSSNAKHSHAAGASSGGAVDAENRAGSVPAVAGQGVGAGLEAGLKVCAYSRSVLIASSLQPKHPGHSCMQM